MINGKFNILQNIDIHTTNIETADRYVYLDFELLNRRMSLRWSAFGKLRDELPFRLKLKILTHGYHPKGQSS